MSGGGASLAVAAIGGLGLLGYALNFELLYSWYAFSTVALHTAAGFALLGTGLLSAAIRQFPAPGDGARIARRSLGLLIVVAGVTAVAGFGAIENEVRNILARGLETALRAGTAQIHTALENRATRAATITTRPNLLRNLRLLAGDPGNSEYRAVVQGVIDSFAPHGFSAIVVRLTDGVEVGRLGKLIESPALALKVNADISTSLLFKDGLYLRHQLPLRYAQGLLGTLVAEQFLPNTTAGLLRAAESFGESSELLLCGPGLQGFDCFPTYLTPNPIALPVGAAGLASLAQRALEGEAGIGATLDQRGRRVLAGFAPVGTFGLVTVLKVDTVEIYRPLSGQFQLMALLVAAISIAGFLLVRRWVRPLATALEEQVRTRTTALAEKDRSEARLQAFMDHSPALMFIKDLEGRYLNVNEIFARAFGLAREGIVSRSDAELFPPEQAAQFKANDARVFASGKAIEVEETAVYGDGLHTNIVSKFPIQDRDGRIIGLGGTVTDITARKRLEVELNRLNRELEDRIVERTQDLRHANEALERSNLELQQFAYIASHDLQTPLRSVSGFVQALKSEYEGKLDSQADDWIRRVVQSVEQMHTLIRDVLEYSSVDSRSRPFDKVRFRGIFDSAVALLDSSIRDSSAQVTCGELPTIMGDPSQLVQLMQNLIGNGITYNRTGSPRVHVSAQREGSEWIFSVRDNGIGIDPKYHERIFKIFKRLHDQSEYPGTGIGLAVCRRVVHRHGGRIWVESEPAGGSAFRFTIPEMTVATP